MIVTTINHKSNVVPMRQTAECVLLEFHASQSDDPKSERIRTLQAAAKFTQEDIKAANTSYESYPASNEIEFEEACLNYLPSSLKMLT